MESPHEGSTGGASRFYYTAKADSTRRGTGNNHPTVKPSASCDTSASCSVRRLEDCSLI